jgi:hypothetical protein
MSAADADKQLSTYAQQSALTPLTRAAAALHVARSSSSPHLIVCMYLLSQAELHAVAWVR